jgi:hypothetical protein
MSQCTQVRLRLLADPQRCGEFEFPPIVRDQNRFSVPKRRDALRGRHEPEMLEGNSTSSKSRSSSAAAFSPHTARASRPDAPDDIPVALPVQK